MSSDRHNVTRDEAQAFLERDFDRNLPLLGGLMFEKLEGLQGVRRGGALVGLGMVLAEEANVPDSLPTVMVDVVDTAALTHLVGLGGWPHRAVWNLAGALHLPRLETLLGHRHDPERGTVYFRASAPPREMHPLVRRLGAEDSGLDLSPCGLSAIALSYWLLRGWPVFGAVEDQRLLGHALAAYPIGDTEEVAAVFTAPKARRRGIASACAAAVVADVFSRGKRAVYVSNKSNHASIRVAEGLGMTRIVETWEIVVE